MNEIKKSLILILRSLEIIGSKLEQQDRDIKAHIEQNSVSLGSDELIIAGLKSTRTSFELLRDEIEELHELTAALFKKE